MTERTVRPKLRTFAYGTGLAAAGLLSLVAIEAAVARQRRYARPELSLAHRGSVGRPAATPLRLVLLGDSTAAGVGVEQASDTVGGQLAELLAADGYRVELSNVAVAGARSGELATQVARALLGQRPDLAVILIGANDAIRPGRAETSAALLGTAVRRLRRAGVPVVAGTCPDLGAARAIAQPLRALVARRGRTLASAQNAAVREAGGVPVDLAAETGVMFRTDPGTLCWDDYHPSADGYRLWAHALAPACRTALSIATH
ncbi:SGNH/GDSL hydrolase family protein [Longispora albida]|uniref:SGNH/GDSL hydrolase family protein n=1 Tax=Longispora albida TaxID=203523 RepID=UPI000375BC86|nr:SGNH/GDSL hydrolase family protein [Longispora albida]